MTTTRDEDIDLVSGEYVQTGQNWKFDLDLGDWSNFQKIESTISGLSFSRQLKIEINRVGRLELELRKSQ